jgi:hypothetical protein
MMSEVEIAMAQREAPGLDDNPLRRRRGSCSLGPRKFTERPINPRLTLICDCCAAWGNTPRGNQKRPAFRRGSALFAVEAQPGHRFRF